MHNIINKLTSLMIGLFSLIFISNSSAFAESSYFETVNIPPYNSNNPSHLLITTTNGKWTSSNLNNASYKHFYVESGDYSTNIITLTADGTENDRRSISLYNGNNTHPASLNTNEQADIKIKFDNASYWDIDRMSFLSYQETYDVDWFYNGSSYNTLNKIYMKDYYCGIRILHNSNYNTIQKSYIDHMTTAGRSSDNVGIALTPAKQGAGTEIRGTKIIGNDIRDSGDGIQLVRQPEDEVAIHYPATTIDDNNIWMDSDVYTDGNGNYDPNGQYEHGEDGMDFKAGSTEPLNPILVTNNRMWGFRLNDGTFGGTTEFNGGGALVIHYGVLNLKFNNNIIFDSLSAIGVTNERAMPTAWSGEMTNNIIYDIGKVNPRNKFIYSIALEDCGDAIFKNNTVVDDINGKYFVAETPKGTLAIDDNVFINCTNSANMQIGATADSNYYYNTTSQIYNNTNSTSYTNTSDANMGDYSFKYERYTASPKTKFLNGIITTKNSPQYGTAGSLITEKGSTVPTPEPTLTGPFILDVDSKILK